MAAKHAYEVVRRDVHTSHDTLIITTEEDPQASDHIDSDDEVHVGQTALAGASALEDIHGCRRWFRVDRKTGNMQD